MRRKSSTTAGNEDSIISELQEKIRIAKNKPMKEAIINSLRDWNINYGPILVNCGIPQKDIFRAMSEPWHYNNLRIFYKWLNNILMPEINKFIDLLNYNTADQWKMMALTSHPDIRRLNIAKERVRRVWRTRPRFPEDAGKVFERGY